MNRRDALKHTALAGGTALLSTSLLSLLQSCSEQSRLSWVPSFFSEEHALLVSSLVDAILPATDTPGGLDVKVDMFIDLVYAKMFPEEAREAVIEEMNAFNEKAKTTYGKAFADLGAEQQTAFLQEEEANSPKINGNVWGTTVGKQEPIGYYRALKSMAIWGYCTSEEIGKNTMKYLPIPGPFQGCVPLEEVGGVWSL